MRKLFSTIWATVRQVVLPFPVYKRDRQGKVLYERNSLGVEPIESPIGTWVARLLSIITVIISVLVAVQEILERL